MKSIMFLDIRGHGKSCIDCMGNLDEFSLENIISINPHYFVILINYEILENDEYISNNFKFDIFFDIFNLFNNQDYVLVIFGQIKSALKTFYLFYIAIKNKINIPKKRTAFSICPMRWLEMIGEFLEKNYKMIELIDG